nr:DNA translocase FtsK [Bacilli bacterium]
MNLDKAMIKFFIIIMIITFIVLFASENNSEALISILIIFAILYWIRYVYAKNKKNEGIYEDTTKTLNNENDGRIIIKKIDDIEKLNSKSVDNIKNEEVAQEVKMYELPKISSYVTDKNLVNLISKQKYKAGLPVTYNDEYELIDLTDNYSMLINGSIASGKSSLIHSIIDDVLLRNKPEEVKMIIIDSKRLEYMEYNGIPHLLTPIITSPKKAVEVLNKLVSEMQNRYDELDRVGAKNISDYNKIIETKNKNGNSNFIKMPYIYLFIDELDDLIGYDKSISYIIKRMLAYARAVGINILCTTTTVAYNMFDIELINSFNSIISFKIFSHRDARLLFENKDSMKLQEYEFVYKIQGRTSPKTYKPVISEKRKELIDYIFGQQKAQYDVRFELDEYVQNVVEDDVNASNPMYKQIVEFVVAKGQASASLLQRRFHIGYNRAATYIDLLEERGIIGPQNGSKPREVIYKLENNNEDE